MKITRFRAGCARSPAARENGWGGAGLATATQSRGWRARAHDLAIELLADEEEHLCLFEGFRKSLEGPR
jgi:hypothetical protein